MTQRAEFRWRFDVVIPSLVLEQAARGPHPAGRIRSAPEMRLAGRCTMDVTLHNETGLGWQSHNHTPLFRVRWRVPDSLHRGGSRRAIPGWSRALDEVYLFSLSSSSYSPRSVWRARSQPPGRVVISAPGAFQNGKRVTPQALPPLIALLAGANRRGADLQAGRHPVASRTSRQPARPTRELLPYSERVASRRIPSARRADNHCIPWPSDT